MTVTQLLTASARKIGAVASGESLTPEELSDWLGVLQSMLRSWSAKGVTVNASVKENFTLVAGTSLYTFGTGGTFNSARPNRIEGVEIRDSSGSSHFVDIISEGRYRSISSKASVGRPTVLFCNYLYPLAYVYTYPVADAAETIYIDSIKPFTEASSYSAVTDTISLPLNYEEPVIYNLAVRIAPEIGKAVSAEVAAIASTSYDGLISLNARNKVEPVFLDFPAGVGQGSYDINEG